MLSNTSKYAIRAVLYLALHTTKNKRIGIKKIADDLNIPSPFLGKILQVLVRRKLLSSTKGPNGGFGVGKNPKDFTLYDVIIEMDGDDLFHDCLLGAGSCGGHKKQNQQHCALHSEYEPLKQEIINLYKSKSVFELLDNANESLDDIVL